MLELVLGLVAAEERLGHLAEADGAVLLGEVDLDAVDGLLDDANLAQRRLVVVVDPLRLRRVGDTVVGAAREHEDALLLHADVVELAHGEAAEDLPVGA